MSNQNKRGNDAMLDTGTILDDVGNANILGWRSRNQGIQDSEGKEGGQECLFQAAQNQCGLRQFSEGATQKQGGNWPKSDLLQPRYISFYYSSLR